MVGCWVACTFRGLASSIEDPQKYGFYYPYCATHRTHRGVKLLAAHPSCPYTVHSRGSAVPIEVEHDFLGGVLNKAFSCGGSSRAVPSQVERGMLGGVMNAVGLRWSSRRGGFVFNQANIFPREIFLLYYSSYWLRESGSGLLMFAWLRLTWLVHGGKRRAIMVSSSPCDAARSDSHASLLCVSCSCWIRVDQVSLSSPR